MSEFVLAGLKWSGAYTPTARCQGAEARKPVDLIRTHLEGKKTLDITVANARPIIRAFYAWGANGQVLRAFSPGQTMEVVAEVRDPDPGDVLSFQWTDGS